MPPKFSKTKARQKGGYAVVLRITSPRKVWVGKLGWMDFSRGHYIYFGSAQGGLQARVSRHLSQDEKLPGTPTTSAWKHRGSTPGNWPTGSAGSVSGLKAPWGLKELPSLRPVSVRRTADALPTWFGSTTPGRRGSSWGV
tara:strand:- start:313 stop:732 length:420 start_codon:yes stop_codon:yes gene_type:complete